jgi:hypothetical protein
MTFYSYFKSFFNSLDVQKTEQCEEIKIFPIRFLFNFRHQKTGVRIRSTEKQESESRSGNSVADPALGTGAF